MGDRLLTIQQLADAIGVHPNSIRRAEAAGILPKPLRTRARADGVNGQRRYTPDDVRRIKAILFPPIEQAS